MWYLFFYLLFSPDTWRIIIGLVAASLLAPLIAGPDGAWFEIGVLFIMLTTIGYAISAKPARYFSTKLRQTIIPNR